MTDNEFKVKIGQNDNYLSFENLNRSYDNWLQCRLSIKAYGFRYDGPIWFDDVKLFDIYHGLQRLYENLSGVFTLENREGEFIKFEVNPKGYVYVSGYITNYDEQRVELKFEFETDQTQLLSFINDLAKIIKAFNK